MKLLHEQFDLMMATIGCQKGMVSTEQYLDMRRCFFAGATAFYTLEMSMLSEGTEPTEYDLSIIRALHNELEQFVHDLKVGKV